MNGAPEKALLTIRFLNYWTAGAGASGGGDVDRTVVRGRSHLPYLPAKQLKGHLRESAKRLAKTGDPYWLKNTGILFGDSPTPDDDALPEDEDKKRPRAAALRFENARLSDAEESTLGASNDDSKAVSEEKARLRAGLFVRLASVRIDQRTGAAFHRAYRRIEAVVPLELTTVVRFTSPALDDKTRAAQQEWFDRLDDVCAITLAAGGLKSDGYGRAVLCLKACS